MTAYKVSPSELRQLQKICYEMLIEIDRICRKNDIQYSVDGGTLLGTVRHHGFIPWDDDVDVIFTRKEYIKFRRVCEKDLDNNRFFLQDYITDPNYRWGYAKLRRKNTIQLREGQENLKQHPGVFVDIFVVDNVPDNVILRNIHHFICFVIRKLQYSPVGAQNEHNVLLRLVYKLLSIFPRSLSFMLRDTLASISNKSQTKLVTHYTWPYPERCKYGVPSECFSEYTDMLFEKTMVRTFKQYDLYLKTVYGDYMTLPPIEKRVSHVEYSKLELIDVDVPI